MKPLKLFCIFLLSLFFVITFFPLNRDMVFIQAKNYFLLNYRENARTYAKEHWNKITDDGFYATDLSFCRSYVKVTPGTDITILQTPQENGYNPEYTNEFTKVTSKIRLVNDSSKKLDNNYAIWTAAEDCAHYISCCIGQGGGLPLDEQNDTPGGCYGYASATLLGKWLVNSGYVDFYENFNSIKPDVGDVIIWDNGIGKHTTMCIDKYSGGLTCHTSERYHGEILDGVEIDFTYESMLSGGWKVYGFYHIRTDDNPPSPPSDKKADLVSPRFNWNPSEGTEGQSFTIKAKIQNIGDESACSSHARIYLSKNDDFDIDDDYFVSSQKVKNLSPDEEVWIEITFTVPDISDGFYGSYSLWPLCLVDSDNEVDESYEDNNLWKCNSPIIFNDKEKNAAPSTLTPSCGGSIKPGDVLFQWSSVDSAKKYQLQIYREYGYYDLAFDSQFTDTYCYIQLNSGTEEYLSWRVRAYISSGWEEWSDKCFFTKLSR